MNECKSCYTDVPKTVPQLLWKGDFSHSIHKFLAMAERGREKQLESNQV